MPYLGRNWLRQCKNPHNYFPRIVENVTMTDLGAEVFRSIEMLLQALNPAVPEPLNNN